MSSFETAPSSTVLYKSYAQTWTVILIELSIDYQGIDLAGLVKLASKYNTSDLNQYTIDKFFYATLMTTEF